MKINIFWFRRDLRLDDNNALFQASSSGYPVLPLFIFDNNITDELPDNDPRITFIYETLSSINNKLTEYGSSVLILKGDPQSLWEELVGSYEINSVYVNKDYEPYAIERDKFLYDKLNEFHGFIIFNIDPINGIIIENKDCIVSHYKPNNNNNNDII